MSTDTVSPLRQRMHVFAQSNQSFSHEAHRGGGCRTVLDAMGLDRQRSQALGYVVVQLTRKACALFLLRIDEAPTYFVRCGFRSAALPSLVKQPRDKRDES